MDYLRSIASNLANLEGLPRPKSLTIAIWGRKKNPYKRSQKREEETRKKNRKKKNRRQA